MYMRHDRVLRREYGDDDMVYSLILTDEGLHVIHTGNALGLPNRASPEEINIASGATQSHLQTLLENEAQLNSGLPSLPSGDDHSALLTFDQVRSAVARTNAPEPLVYLRTKQGDFHFVFTYSTGQQVEEMLEALDERVRRR